MVSAPVRVEQARFAQGRGVGLPRACALTGVSRSSVYYRPKMPPKDEAVIKVMKELSGKHPIIAGLKDLPMLTATGVKSN